MSNDLTLTGATVGNPCHIVVYYDVNTNNLYDGNGQLYGNRDFSAFLGNIYTMELHYVQDVSTSSNPDDWIAWDGLKGMAVSSTISFDDDYIHALKGEVAINAVQGATTVRINIPDVDKDVLGFTGSLVFNPFGIDLEDAVQNETRPIKKTANYSSYTYISGTIFEFKIDSGLPLAVSGGTNATLVRVSEPLYLFIDSDDIYESNIPNRYEEGVFKIPMNINSRKLVKTLDYSNVYDISGVMEHDIYIDSTSLSGIVVSGSTLSRTKANDKVAIDATDGATYVFCNWSSGSTSYWTRGNEIESGDSVYTVSNGTASVAGTTNPVSITVPVLFRTFSFPFVVKNLVDF